MRLFVDTSGLFAAMVRNVEQDGLARVFAYDDDFASQGFRVVAVPEDLA